MAVITGDRDVATDSVLSANRLGGSRDSVLDA